MIRVDTTRENTAMIRLMRSRGAIANAEHSDGSIVSYDLQVPGVDETTGALYDLILSAGAVRGLPQT